MTVQQLAPALWMCDPNMSCASQVETTSSCWVPLGQNEATLPAGSCDDELDAAEAEAAIADAELRGTIPLRQIKAKYGL